MVPARHKISQSGNVLFLILIAVAMFAALSFVVTQSTRSGGGSTENERSKLHASVITQYSTSIRTATVKLQLGRGCGPKVSAYWAGMADLQMNMYDDGGEILEKCQIYNPAAGGATYSLPLSVYLDNETVISAGAPWAGRYWITGSYCLPFQGLGNETCDGDSADLAFVFPYISPVICRQINKGLGIPETDGDVPEQPDGTIFPDIATFPFDGTYAPEGNVAVAVTGALSRFPEGCFKRSSDNIYVYYAPLLAR